MKRLWTAWSAKYDAMPLRERLLVGAAAVLTMTYLVYAFAMSPSVAERRALSAQMEKQQAQIAVIERAVRDEQQQRSESAAGLRKREDDLRKQLAEADETIRALHKSLVPAQRVPVLLREMVTRDTALQIQSVRTLPVSPLMPGPGQAPASADAAGADAPEVPERGVYKHGVEITVRGSYSALHAYLARLERSPSRMYWWRARLSADARAALTMTLTIYTLSLDKAWLQV